MCRCRRRHPRRRRASTAASRPSKRRSAPTRWVSKRRRDRRPTWRRRSRRSDERRARQRGHRAVERCITAAPSSAARSPRASPRHRWTTITSSAPTTPATRTTLPVAGPRDFTGEDPADRSTASAAIEATGNATPSRSSPTSTGSRRLSRPLDLADAVHAAQVVDRGEPARRWRSAMIASANVGPMPGSSSSCACVAVEVDLAPVTPPAESSDPALPPPPVASPGAAGSDCPTLVT